MAALKVGIIGASALSGWARESHVPAVQALHGLELAAVATQSRETAIMASKAFGVQAYHDGLKLCKDPKIDIVTIATRVPDHHRLVMAALLNEKHVYCEWPLGMGSFDTEQLALAANASSRHVVVGLQLRGNPAVRRVIKILRENAIGRMLSINISCATVGFGRVIPEQYLYLEKPENFANLLTIQGGHTLDLAVMLAGEFLRFNALASRQFPVIEAGEKHQLQSRKTFDHLLVQGATDKGVTVAVEVSGGRPSDTPFRLEMVGELGRIELLGGAPRGFQSGVLRLLLNGKEQYIDDGELTGLVPSAVNVGGLYAVLRDDILAGTRRAPDFTHALRLTRLIESMLDSSQS